jgi:hypothetical protein
MARDCLVPLHALFDVVERADQLHTVWMFQNGLVGTMCTRQRTRETASVMNAATTSAGARDNDESTSSMYVIRSLRHAW